jgi:WD40 repeat protein/predicted Ser/Thr protein kinase
MEPSRSDSPASEATVDLGAAYRPTDAATSVRYYGDYELVRELARGGMGIVYQARQVSLNRIVALKMILAGQLATEADVRRFRHEAEAAASLDHSGIVPVYEVGEHEGLHYFSMGFVEGESLAHKVAAGPLPAALAADLVCAVAEAVQYAHEHGVIHRDLKPANVLIDSQGRPKVTDFGLAKRIGGDSGLTATGQVMGTPSYMAPEQAAGSAEVGIAADVYSLGAILYHLLTGRPPFQSATVIDTLLQVRERAPAPPRQLNSQVPPDLETICLKCLSKEPHKRYATAGEMAADLKRWLTGVPIHARPVPTWERAIKWARRRPAIAALVAVSIVAAMALIGVGVGLWYNERLQAALVEASRQRTQAQTQRWRAMQSEQIARRYWYAADLNWAQRNRERGELGAARALLDRQRPGPFQEDLRGFEWSYIQRLCRARDGVLATYPTEVGAVACSPDGTSLAVATGEPGAPGVVWLWDMTRRQSRSMLTGTSGRITSLAFSPDGATLVAASHERGALVWDVATGRERAVLRGHAKGVACVAFAPDGKTLATCGFDPIATLWDPQNGRERASLKGHERALVAVAFTPDGRTLATAGIDKTIKLWDVATNQVRSTLPSPGAELKALAVAPDGATLVSVARDEKVTLWDLATGKLRATLSNGKLGAVQSVAFARDGKTVAAGGYQTVTVWDLATQRVKATLKGHGNWVYALAYAPDKRTLVTGSWDKTVRLWDTAASSERVFLGRQRWTVRAVAFAPDGRVLVSADYTNIKLFDVRSGQELATLPAHHWVFSAAFAPDGATLATAGPEGETGAGRGIVKLWNIPGRALRATLDPRLDQALSLAFSPDGTTLAIAGEASEKGVVRLWDVAAGRERNSLSEQPGEVGSVAFSPDGLMLATASGSAIRGAVKVWDRGTLRERAVLAGSGHVAFSPDSTTLAYGGDGGVVMRDLTRGEERFALGANAGALAFSPDGRTLATAGGSTRNLTLWQVSTGQELIAVGTSFPVDSLAFSPDGKTLAVGSGFREENEGAILLRGELEEEQGGWLSRHQ